MEYIKNVVSLFVIACAFFILIYIIGSIKDITYFVFYEDLVKQTIEENVNFTCLRKNEISR